MSLPFRLSVKVLGLIGDRSLFLGKGEVLFNDIHNRKGNRGKSS